MNVIWTEPAAAALESIQDYIARNNPQAAWDVAQKIRNAVTRLPDNPKLGRTGRVHGTFELMIAGLPYVVPYRIKGHQIQILTVYHSSRKWPDVFL
ncbi:MAG: type II toxin-antitoxin system RelE/ParE family toxin [Gammaproteobacteria bacterium]|nr:type II toxin-antitoxin system RelE/ParE family toxin [Gammaproteobacteria bacterium]MCF6362317.1 type II toxin-antitoxin system RelE/ParE family toxin [Gammaproteobacteria bacterium]